MARRYESHLPSKRSRHGAAPMIGSYGSRGPMLTGTATRAARRRRTAWVVSVVVLAAVAVAIWWVASRPVAFAVTPTPADASISVVASPPGSPAVASCTGTLSASGVRPGSYVLAVSRTGFATQTVTVQAKRFRTTRAPVALAPLPQTLRVSATPSSAVIRVTDTHGTVLAEKTGTLSAKLPAQQVRIRVTASGKNPFERAMLIDRPTRMAISLDPKGQLVHGLGLISTSGAPKGVAMTPDGSEAWATILNGPPSIEIFEPVSGKRLGEVDLGKYGAVEIVFNRAGTRAYASQMETAKVFEIDVKKRKVLRSFKTGSAWTKVVALSPDEKTLYAANWSGNDVSVIDVQSGKLVRRIPVAKTPRGLWPTADGKYLYVASFDRGVIERVNLATYAVKTIFRGGGAMRHLVADEQRKVLFTSDMAKDCVWITDMTTGKTRLFAKVGHKPNTIALSPDGRVLFVSNRGENNPVSYYLIGPEWGSILLLDARMGKPLDGIVGGNQCTALAVSGDGKLLVFSDFLDNRLRVYEVPRYEVLAAGHGGRSATLSRDVRK